MVNAPIHAIFRSAISIIETPTRRIINRTDAQAFQAHSDGSGRDRAGTIISKLQSSEKEKNRKRNNERNELKKKKKSGKQTQAFSLLHLTSES